MPPTMQRLRNSSTEMRRYRSRSSALWWVVNGRDMGKVFRNEGISPKHSPEFTIIEFMCAYSDYNDVATVTEEMFRDVAQAALGRTTIKRNGEDIDLAKPWRRVTMRDLIMERFGVDFME